VSLGLLRCALIVGCRLELRSRDRHLDQAREHGPSPLFYACVAIGSTPLALLVVNLGAHYLVVVATSLALSAIVVVRQFLTAREAVQSDRARRKTEARFGWLVATRRTSSWPSMRRAPSTTSARRSSGCSRNRRTSCSGTPLVDLAHPEDKAELESLVGRAMASPGRRVSGEWRIRQSDGTWLPVETVASSGTGDFDTTGVVLNTRDLAERKA